MAASSIKKMLFLFLLIPFLLGCEELYLPTYTETSEVHLTGGKWIFTDYQIVRISSISSFSIIYNDTICVNAFGEQSYVDGGILMQQHYEYTSIDRRFVKGVTIWEFDDNSNTLYINDNTNIRFPVNYPAYLKYEHTEMSIQNPLTGAVSNYTFYTDAMGANYPRILTLISPPIVSDLLLSNGMRDKAITVQIILIFTR